MHLFKTAIIVALFLLQISHEKVLEIQLRPDDQEEHTLENYKCESSEYQISTPMGRKLIIEVKNFKSKINSKDFLLIKRGPDFNTEGNGALILNKIEDSYLMGISSNIVFIKYNYEGNPEEICDSGFEITYKQDDTEIEKSTERPTTTEFPQLKPEDDVYFTAYVTDKELLQNNYYTYNKRYHQFLSSPTFLQKFRTSVAKMALNFCHIKMIALEKPITERNVIIVSLTASPLNWPESEKYVAINFAVPVIQKDKTAKYKLNSEELKEMWNRYKGILGDFQIVEYHLKTVDDQLIVWTCMAAAMLATFTVVLVVSRVHKKKGIPLLEKDESSIQSTTNLPHYLKNAEEFQQFKCDSEGNETTRRFQIQ